MKKTGVIQYEEEFVCIYIKCKQASEREREGNRYLYTM